MDSGREFIERKYLHRQNHWKKGVSDKGSDALVRFSRIRTVLLAFNIAATLAVIAMAVLLIA